MKIHNQNISNYNLKVISYKDILNMPSRTGDTSYNWGSTIEPLVHKEAIYWKSKVFSIQFFVENTPIKTVIDKLKVLPRVFILESDFGTFNVSLVEAKRDQKYLGNNHVITLYFEEEKTEFNTPLETKKGGSNLTIDGYDLLNDFDVLLEEIKSETDLPNLKESLVTVFGRERPLSGNRNLGLIQLNCNSIYSSRNTLTNKISQLQSLLASPGLRTITHNNQTFSCYLTDGFVVNFKGNNLVSFNIKLNRML